MKDDVVKYRSYTICILWVLKANLNRDNLTLIDSLSVVNANGARFDIAVDNACGKHAQLIKAILAKIPVRVRVKIEISSIITDDLPFRASQCIRELSIISKN